MAKTTDPGLGSNYNQELKRMVNADGSYNMIRRGALRGIRDFYKFLIDATWWQFILLSLCYYLAVNAIFDLKSVVSGARLVLRAGARM